ncbi:MAG: hypothetical protein WA633_13920 [Stellaceae bacterium]
MVKPDLVSARRHPAGFLEARAGLGTGRHGEILADFLQSDVQGDLATAQALLAEVEAAQRDETPQPGGVGNAYSITIAPDGAVIRNAVLEGALPEHFSLGEVRVAIEMWITAIERALGHL